MKKYIFLAFIVLGIVAAPRLSRAVGLPNQPTQSDTFYINASSSNSFTSIYEIYNVGAGVVLNNFDVIINPDHPGHDYLDTVQDGAWSSGLDLASAAHTLTASDWTWTTSTVSGALVYHYVLNSPLTFTDNYFKLNFKTYALDGSDNFTFFGVNNGHITDNVSGTITHDGLHGYLSWNFEFYICVNGVCIPPSPPGASMTGGFIFPSSTYSGPDFSNWALQLYFSATNTVYTGSVVYQVGSAFNNSLKYYQDYFSINPGNATSVRWTVPKSTSLFSYQNNNGTSSQWTSLLFDTSNGPSPSSSQAVFTITPFATTTPTAAGANLAGPFFFNAVQGASGQSSWEYQNIASSAAFLASQCTPAADWTDIGGGLRYALCATINYLLIPNGVVTESVNTQMTALRGDFPFNMVYGTIGVIGAAAEAVSSTQNMPLTLTIWNMNIPVLSSSTLSGFVGDSNKTLIFTIESGIAWVGVAFTILKIIF